MPEYSEGIERVVLSDDGRSRVCYFPPASSDAEGLVLREHIRWEVPNVGYSTSRGGWEHVRPRERRVGCERESADERDAVRVDQYYDHANLAGMRASFDAGLVDMGDRLVARFGGRFVRRYVDAG